MNQQYRIAIIGPQGSGKGTQGNLLAAVLHIPELSMGQMLRDEIEADTSRGKQVKDIVDAGELVSFEITLDLLQDRIAKPDCKNGFIIDGFPRKFDQYDAFKKIGGPTHVIALELSDNVAIERLGGRRVCANCDAIYHLVFQPPKQAGICDACGGVLEIRHDDTPDAIQERLNVYHEDTEPVIVAYEKDGILHRIDASSSIEEIHQSIRKSLNV